jgi:spore coat polysaccharide biosynthesis predicted glycosyltransferase SpsG
MMNTDAVGRRVLFRCDGTRTTGLGHLSRCIALARSLRLESPSASTLFWGHFDSFAKTLLAHYGLREMGMPPPPGNVNGLAATRETCIGYDTLVLDSYDLDQDYIDGLKHRPCRLALIDDDQRHDLSGANLVICFLASAQALNYGATHQFLGPSYLPVKPELRALRERNLALPIEHGIRRVLVFLSGGHMGENLLPAVLGALDLPATEVTYLAPTALAASRWQNASHVALTPDIESVYAQTDFVICGGGLTKYESAYCAIPNACLSLTTLQQADTQAMAAQNLTLDLGMAGDLDPRRLRRQIADFIGNPAARVVQRQAFASKLDSNGQGRVTRTLLSL